MAVKPEGAGGWWTGEGWRWIIVTLLIPFAGFVWNEVEKHDADRQRSIEDKRAQSEIVIKLLPALAHEPADPSRGIALAVLSDMAEAGALRKELKTAVDLAIKQSDDRARAGTATEGERVVLTSIASKQDVEPGTTPTAGAADARTGPVVTTPRVYVQIFDDAERAQANDLRAWIGDTKHWLAPGVENVVATAARKGREAPKGTAQTRVVYFNQGDAQRADEIAQWIRQSQSGDVVVQPSNLKAPPGQIEVWYPQRSG